MSNTSIIAKVEELKEMEALLDETKAIVDSLKDELKAELNARETEELDCGQYVIRLTSVLTSRFDTKAFKEKMGEEMYKLFTKEVASKRFSIACWKPQNRRDSEVRNC